MQYREYLRQIGAEDPKFYLKHFAIKMALGFAAGVVLANVYDRKIMFPAFEKMQVDKMLDHKS